MEFDPQRISYNELLDIFWDSHNPESRSYLRQYMSIIFFHDDAQKQQAQQSREERQRKAKIFTEIMPAAAFYPAESYHQKYYLRGVSELIGEFRRIYAEERDFVDSTAAARVNGYIAGYGSLSKLEAEIDVFGLSATGKKVLIEIVSRQEERAVAP